MTPYPFTTTSSLSDILFLMLLFVHFQEFPTPPLGSAHYPFIQFQLLFSTYASPFHYQHFLPNTSGLLCDCSPPLYWFIVSYLYVLYSNLVRVSCATFHPRCIYLLYVLFLKRVSCAAFCPRFVDLFVYLSFDTGLLCDFSPPFC